MRAKVLIILIAFLISVTASACSESSGYRIDVEGYRKKVRENRKNPMTPEQRKKTLKSIFPNLKDD